MKSDEDVRNMAGHPDVIPAPYREWFLKGYRAKENETNTQRQTSPWNYAPLEPTEVARHCPNCGKVCWGTELNHSSSGGITKLYGVCKECADRHSKNEI